MTRHPRIEFNKDTLPFYLSVMKKEEILELIAISFSKQQLVDSVKLIFSQTHPDTYEKMERYINKKYKNEQI